VRAQAGTYEFLGVRIQARVGGYTQAMPGNVGGGKPLMPRECEAAGADGAVPSWTWVLRISGW